MKRGFRYHGTRPQRLTLDIRGFTLVELVVSLIGAGVLLAGLGSALIVALKASDPALTQTPSLLEGIARLTDLQAELQYALTVPEKSSSAITVTIPDRSDADADDEIVRYAWSGTPGDPLTRQFNNGRAISVAENVHQFVLNYYESGSGIDYITVRLQITEDANMSVETGFAVWNEL